MTARNYGEYLGSLSRINPTDYQDPGTQAHLRANAAPLDDLVLRARTVMLARLIQFAPEDALLLIGQERGIRRYPGEPLDVYRQRVQGAWAYWQQAGTVPGLQLALAQAGYRSAVIEHFRDDPTRWAEFSVIVTPLEPLEPDAHWSQDDTFGGGKSWGYVLPAVPLDWLPELIRDVKAAHSRLRRLTFYPRGRFWGGYAAWGEGRTPPPPAPPPGVYTGVWVYPPDANRTDNGPAWGESDAEIIYEYPGAPDA